MNCTSPDINDFPEGVILELRPNVKMLYNNIIHLYEETDLIVSTLWEHITPAKSYLMEKCLSDFSRKKRDILFEC